MNAKVVSKVKEILVVFLIFLVLVAIALPKIGSSRGSDKRSHAKSYCTNIKVAILAYNSDYGELPVPKGAIVKTGSDVNLGVSPGADPSNYLPGTANFFLAISGNFNSYDSVATSSSVTGLNSRNIPYLSLVKSEVDQHGIAIQSYQDENGKVTYFGIKLDANYDNTLDGLPDLNMGTFTLGINDVAAVWSNNDQPFNKPNIRWSTTY